MKKSVKYGIISRGDFIESIYSDDGQIMVLATLARDNPMMASIFLLGITTGLRISDILSIKTAQFGQKFAVKTRKTGKKMGFILPEDIWRFLEIYANSRAHGHDDRLFPTSRQTVWRYFKNAGSEMGVAISPHDMRRIYAWHVLRSSGCLQTVRKALGHKYVSVTVLYLIGAILWVANVVSGQLSFKPAIEWQSIPSDYFWV